MVNQTALWEPTEYTDPPMGGASLSPCGRYRHRLWRAWNHDDRMLFVGLNPSTADASINDATVCRMLRFAWRECAGGIEVVNLFDFRATKPADLWAQPDGDKISDGFWPSLYSAIQECDKAVLCWGDGGKGADQGTMDASASLIIEELMCCGIELLHFGTTKAGNPKHPLYLAAKTPLKPWVM